MHNMLWRARTSTLRSPNSKGVPSVMVIGTLLRGGVPF